ncbi:MAG: hypothetical protein LBL65_03030 [Campylobacteraceae bacterium]|jgi:hypothetical protein|nr:hypothetical protein [Campylobacteraceae bacterium]
MKLLLKRVRSFLWGGMGEYLNNDFMNVVHRNIEDYENKRRFDDPIYLDRFGYKTYSQNDEDGIIAEIFRRMGGGGVKNRTFIEFGAENGLENNTHFLLHKGWKGLWIEGSKKSYTQILSNFRKPISENRLEVINAFVNKDNINDLISKNKLGISAEIDLLSIDIDGNDYWVWQAISCVTPKVVVIEYNAKFPPDFEWIMEYDENHIWEKDDNQGASLKSFELLGRKLGYQLVGTSFTGSNAFFVKQEYAKELFPKPATAENLYHAFRFVRYKSGHPAKKYIGN